ncbi:MAG: DUF3955 domain-containing protein [Erysipelotrichaceae bacterium]
MNFGEEIKKIREANGLTQQQFADKLNVTRQAISNWENNKNLPDIEMLISIADKFDLSLDQLLMKDGDDNMKTKIIKDGSETLRAKYNMVTTLIGSFLLVMGAFCFFVKAASVEYIDEQGFLHENFFLIPIGYLLLLSGIIVLLIQLFKNIRKK